MSATVMGGGLLLYWFQNSSLEFTEDGEFTEEGEGIEELSMEGEGLEFLLKCGEVDKLVDNGVREDGDTDEGLRSERKKLVFNPPTVLCRLFGVNDDVLGKVGRMLSGVVVREVDLISLLFSPPGLRAKSSSPPSLFHTTVPNTTHSLSPPSSALTHSPSPAWTSSPAVSS